MPTPTTPRIIFGLLVVVTGLQAIVTNYATSFVPPWISENPLLVWSSLVLLLIGAYSLMIHSAGSSTAESSTKSRSLKHKRDARLVRCLACGKTILVSFRKRSAGSWECAKCGKRSTAEEDSTGRITITTPDHGTVRFVQHTRFFGMLTKTYDSEVLERGARPTAGHHDLRETAEPGATVVRKSIGGMFKREFRSAFIRGLLRDRRAKIAVWILIGAFFVPFGPPRTALEFGWHYLLGLCMSATIVLCLFWFRGRHTFNVWLNHREAFYCWLQRPSALALAVIMRSGDLWHIEALRAAESQGERSLGVELMQDICRHADRERLTLSINATDPDWLINSLHFEHAPEQPRPHKYTVLTRSPQPMQAPFASKRKSKRPKRRTGR